MTVTVKVGKTVVKAIVQFFNSQITDACSAQSGDTFVRGLGLPSGLLQNSLTYLKKYQIFNYLGVILVLF